MVKEEPAITLSLDHVPIEIVIDKITAQTGFIVDIENKLKDALITGEFQSLKVSSFLRKIFKSQNVFIAINMDSKTILARIVASGISKGDSQRFKSTKDNIQNEESQSSSLSLSSKHIIAQGDRYGGINELPDLPAPKESDNNNHLIDPQTGLEWDVVEAMLK